MDDASLSEYFHGFVKSLSDEIALLSRLKGNSNIVSYEDHMIIENPEGDGTGWTILREGMSVRSYHSGDCIGDERRWAPVAKNTINRRKQMNAILAGIDVSKGWSMVAAIHSPRETVWKPRKVMHTAAALERLAYDIKALGYNGRGEVRVVMEATGRSWKKAQNWVTDGRTPTDSLPHGMERPCHQTLRISGCNVF